jgi:hypothetical protein
MYENNFFFGKTHFPINDTSKHNVNNVFSLLFIKFLEYLHSKTRYD